MQWSVDYINRVSYPRICSTGVTGSTSPPSMLTRHIHASERSEKCPSPKHLATWHRPAVVLIGSSCGFPAASWCAGYAIRSRSPQCRFPYCSKERVSAPESSVSNIVIIFRRVLPTLHARQPRHTWEGGVRSKGVNVLGDDGKVRTVRTFRPNTAKSKRLSLTSMAANE